MASCASGSAQMRLPPFFSWQWSSTHRSTGARSTWHPRWTARRRYPVQLSTALGKAPGSSQLQERHAGGGWRSIPTRRPTRLHRSEADRSSAGAAQDWCEEQPASCGELHVEHQLVAAGAQPRWCYGAVTVQTLRMIGRGTSHGGDGGLTRSAVCELDTHSSYPFFGSAYSVNIRRRHRHGPSGQWLGRVGRP